MRAVCLLSLCLFGASALDDHANPIRKIVTLMQDMQKEIDAEGAKEKELFDKFMCFCNGGTQDLEKDIADAKQTAKTLTARLDEMTSEKTTLTQDIASHKEDLAAATQDLEKSAALREKEQAEFEDEYKSKKASADALSKAIPAIEKGAGASSLMQSPEGNLVPALKRALGLSQQISGGDRQRVLSFLNDGAPGSANEVAGMLKAMLDEFTRDSEEIAKNEEVAVKTFNGMKASKQNDVALAKSSVESKKARTGQLAVEIVQSQNGLEDANEELAKTTKFLATLDAQCAAKKKDWAFRSNMREQEKAAIGEAIAILNDDDALDVFKKAVLLQTPAGHQTGFLQSKSKGVDRLRKAQDLINSVAKLQKGKCHQLDMLQYTIGSKLQAALKGPVDFGAVVKMVDEMTAVLKRQGKDDAKHKEWCMAQLTENEANEKRAQDKMDNTAAAMQELSDEASTLDDDIATLKEDVQALDKDVAQATAQRKQDHSVYQEEATLTETAVALLGKAKNRLQKFYNPTLYKAPPKKEASMEDKILSSGSSALAQSEMNFDMPDEASFAQLVKQPEAPETYGAYKKKGQKSGGIMALMDMLTSELEKSKVEASMEEKHEQGSYVAFMSESQASREQMLKSLTDKESSKADIGSRITQAKEQKHLSMEELMNVNEYSRDLHGSCDFIVQNFETRVAAREQELEGLANAKAVLSGANFS